jgi:hypothetical protein
VPTKTASALCVHRSRSSEVSTRGLNWLEASCSATIVIEKVSPAKVRTEVATVCKMARAESGPPPYSRPAAPPYARSSRTVTSAATPASTAPSAGSAQNAWVTRSTSIRTLIASP